MRKTYTILYNPNRDYDEQAWTQVAVEAKTYSEAQELAHLEAEKLGHENGFYSWRLYDRKPSYLNQYNMRKLSVKDPALKTLDNFFGGL